MVLICKPKLKSELFEVILAIMVHLDKNTLCKILLMYTYFNRCHTRGENCNV